MPVFERSTVSGTVEAGASELHGIDRCRAGIGDGYDLPPEAQRCRRLLQTSEGGFLTLFRAQNSRVANSEGDENDGSLYPGDFRWFCKNVTGLPSSLFFHSFMECALSAGRLPGRRHRSAIIS